MMSTITTSTENALDSDLLKEIRESVFCIVGCGAVGAAFAEMLVRTGAKKIRLIDGDKVELKNLNRMIGFFGADVCRKKVHVLTEHLKRINKEIEDIRSMDHHFRDFFPGDEKTPKVRDMVAGSDVVVIAMDNNSDRISCENLCHDLNKRYLSVGVRVDKERNFAGYECIWKPTTPEEKKDNDGYGDNNGSFASIVLEATAAGFNLMLHHLQNPDTPTYKKWEKGYVNFQPFEDDTDCDSLLDDQK